MKVAFAAALVAAGAYAQPASSTPASTSTAPSVDLGYAVYEGSYDANNSINVFKGYAYTERMSNTHSFHC